MKIYGIAGSVAAALLVAGHGSAWAQLSSRAGEPGRTHVSQGEEGVRWDSLTPDQRKTLEPLQREWPSIDSLRKQKWIALASRFQTLKPGEQARITARMSEWARLSPSERGQARLRFEEARSVPAPDRNARWQAYQALPPDARQRLAERAAAERDRNRREAAASRSSSTGQEAREAKANVVTNPAAVQPVKQVAPTLVQAAPGATTTPITRRPAPPPHQQIGMPKIAATPEFVNRSTLLPKRGPQAAAVTPTSAQPAPPARVTPIVQPQALQPTPQK